MRRFLLRRWTETCLLVPLLTCGCRHSQPCPTTCDAPNAVRMGAPIAAPVVPATAPANPAPRVDSPAPMSQPILPTAAPASPVLHTVNKPALPTPIDPLLASAPPHYSSAPDQPKMRQSLFAVQPDRQHSLPAAKPAEAASGPRYGHDPKYRWLVGTLEYSRIQQAWLLRYVSEEEEDRYGGCVTLVPANNRMTFKPGQVVRVEGALIDPESQQLRPAFEVQTIRAD